jgi:hypothetical protein
MMATTASSCTTSTATATATESFLPAHRVSNDSDDGLGSASSSPQPVGPPDADPDDDNDKIMRTTMPGSEVQQQAKTDIGALVAKSKRAASSLWTLLHAKVGVLSTFVLCCTCRFLFLLLLLLVPLRQSSQHYYLHDTCWNRLLTVHRPSILFVFRTVGWGSTGAHILDVLRRK